MRALGSVLLCTLIGFSLPGGRAIALPPPLPLEEALAGADLVVVGQLGKLRPERPGTTSQDVVGYVQVTKVLKGPKELSRVMLRTIARQLPGPVKYRTGDQGIWILTQTETEGLYEGGNPTSLQPAKKLAKVKTILKRQAR